MGKESDQPVDPNLPDGYFGKLMSNFSPMKSLTRFGLNKAFQGLTQGSGMGGFGAVLPIAGIAGLAYMLNKNRLGLTGYTTQRGYEKARQDRINMKRQSNIIKTLESGKYVPGWEKTAFERVQKLGKNLNLVDADDLSLTTKKHIPSGPTIVPHVGGADSGSGSGNVTPGGMGMSTVGGGDPFYNKGGRVRYADGGIVDLL